MSINLKIKAQYKEELIKSPRNMTPEHAKKVGLPRNMESVQLRTFIRAYRKEVQLPINFQSSIFMSKTPQRCLDHNSIITLYCINDKKPLCPNCMYQIVAHGKHEVIPLNKATSTLQTELANTIKDINNRLLPTMNALISKSQTNLDKMEKEMGEFMKKVDQYYSQIINFINSKRNQQILQYQNIWNRLRFEYSTFTNELIRINQYMNDKIKDISQKNSQENLLYFHNVAIYLHKMDQIIAPPFCQYQQLNTKWICEKLEQARESIKRSISFQSNIIKQEVSNIAEKEVSYSLKKDKMSWMSKKSQLGTSNHKSTNPQKSLLSPRAPFYLKNLGTLRQGPEHSPKTQSGHRFFQKNKSLKGNVGFEKRLDNRKSETNMYFTQK